MYKFYVIFKNQDTIEGTTTMPSDEFSKKIINPNIDDVDTYQFWDETDDEPSDFDLVDNTIPDEDQVDVWWPNGEDIQQEPINTDYIVVSTSFTWNETLVFPANEIGQITDWGELAGIRNMTSTDHNTTMHMVDMYNDYEFVKVVSDIHPLYRTLWKKK